MDAGCLERERMRDDIQQVREREKSFPPLLKRKCSIHLLLAVLTGCNESLFLPISSTGLPWPFVSGARLTL